MIVKIAVWGAITPNVMTPFAVIFICILTYWQVAVCGVPIIDACATLGLLYHAAQQAITIPTTYQKFLAAAGSIDVYERFLKDISENREYFYDGKKNRKQQDFSGDIRLEKICFSYNSSGKNVIKDVTLTIPSKSLVGFVGESGSGKSTLVNIITGLLLPESGRISLSGIPYSDLDIPELRKSIAYVTQEAVIFRDTVINNISMWDPEVSESEIKKASQKAFADEFI